MESIQLNQDLKDLDGEPMNASRDCCVQKSNGDLTTDKVGNYVILRVPTPDDKLDLRKVCINALITDRKDEHITADEKYAKYKLFRKFHEAKDNIELESGDIESVKKYIGQYWPTLIMGQAYDMLEGK